MDGHIDLEKAAWGSDPTRYRRLEGANGLSPLAGSGGKILSVDPDSLSRISREAFHDAAFFLQEAQLAKLAAAIADPRASDSDRFVAASLLKNAAIASGEVLPLCQDTGTATIMAWRGEGIVSGADDYEALACGARTAYLSDNLRFSQLEPTSFFSERDTRDNMPAQVDIAYSAENAYRFVFIAKGGGSTNKTSFFQETKALLNPRHFRKFLEQHIPRLGTSACPPYHLAVVVGGTSPEYNLKVLKLSSAGVLDGLSGPGSARGIFRDAEWEAAVMDIARESGLGAQFGGTYLALDARVIRLPRHAASCPVSLGLSCNAHRNLRGYLSREGAFLEELERNPARFLPTSSASAAVGERIDLDRPMEEIRRELARCAAGDLVLLSGPLIVARDQAHARLKEMLDRGEALPAWFRDHPVCYAGPAETPPGRAIGSFGPTTAGRMDSYVEDFMSAGASFVTLAKGNRSESVRLACERHGGTYLAAIGGAAALIACEHIVSNEAVAFPELGMEAARLIRVRELPAFVVIDSRGRDLYAVARKPDIG
jgi:fumarate hydratase, class I